MSADQNAARNELARMLARDLATLTFDEIQAKWDGALRLAAETALGREWGILVPASHNPIFYLAERVFFDQPGVRGNPRYLYAPYHRELFCRPIMEHILNPDPDVVGLLWLGPRETYKSTLLRVVLLWYALRRMVLEGTFVRTVLRHHKDELAAANLSSVRMKVWHHKWVRWAFPEICPPPGVREFGNQGEFSFWNMPDTGDMAEPMFKAVGAKTSDTGTHHDLDLGDDLVNEDHIHSRKIREDSKLRYASRRYTVDSISGREVNVGTRYHVSDLWGMMIDSKATDEETGKTRLLYRTIKVPAIADDGTLAHPYKLTKKFLEMRRQEEISNNGNDLLWWLQFQLEPRITKYTATNVSWLRYCKFAEIGQDAIPLITIDPAWKGSENAGEGDSASVQVWMLERRGSLIFRYLVDGVHSDNLTVVEGMNHIFRLMAKYAVVLVVPQEYGGHDACVSMQNEANTRAVPIQIIHPRSQQSKAKHGNFRILALLKEVEQGRVFLVEDTLDIDLREAFVKQYRDQHPQMDHDDALDAASTTCTKEIAEAFTPQWNAALDRQRKMRLGLFPKKETEEARTRYTGL